MFKGILVAYDGSESAQAALQTGIALARALEGDLASISIEEHLPRYAATLSEVEGARERIEDHFRALTEQARAAAAVEGVDLDTQVRQGSAEVTDRTFRAAGGWPGARLSAEDPSDAPGRRPTASGGPHEGPGTQRVSSCYEEGPPFPF